MLYALSSGTSHSAQYALAAMLKAAYEGKYDFRKEVNVYGERARKLKEIFCRHKFYVVYDKDLDEPIADGFYFTIGYPGMTSGQLALELMYYGVSAICLITCGPNHFAMVGGFYERYSNLPPPPFCGLRHVDHALRFAVILFVQYPIQDVAPSAVRIADAIETMICTINLVVSFFVIIYSFLC